MLLIVLCLLVGHGVASQYRVIKTEDEYTFEVSSRFARAYYDEYKHQLSIKAPGFHRTWNLPDDALGSKARTFRDRFWLQVVVPRVNVPDIRGGEVPRGTVIRLKATNVCLTTDGSDPVCGRDGGCANGLRSNAFTVEEDDTLVKVRSCKVSGIVRQAHFSAFDPDIVVEDVEDMEAEPVHDEGAGTGWFDRHGNERAY